MAGVAVVTVVLDSAIETEGVPIGGVVVGVTWNPMVPVTSLPAIVAVPTTRSAPLAPVETGDRLTVARPVESVNADAGVKLPSEPIVEKLTTCPAMATPAASLTVAVTVAGAEEVTAVLDRLSEIVGAPTTGGVVDVIENPIEPVKRLPLTVTWTTARSAPAVVAVAGESLALAIPLASVKAEGTLKLPRPSTVENLTN
jgi:hypothetical protein